MQQNSYSPLAVLTSAANRPGNTSRAKIREKATEIELTNPKSLMTGTGESSRTMNPQIVVPADITRDAPVVEYIYRMAAQVPSPSF